MWPCLTQSSGLYDSNILVPRPGSGVWMAHVGQSAYVNMREWGRGDPTARVRDD